jgi:hypothetical protein
MINGYPYYNINGGFRRIAEKGTEMLGTLGRIKGLRKKTAIFEKDSFSPLTAAFLHVYSGMTL